MNTILKVTSENLLAVTMLYMRRLGAYGPENYKLMTDFKAWLTENDLMQDNTTILAIAWDNPLLTLPEKCRYDVGAIVSREIPSPQAQITSPKIRQSEPQANSQSDLPAVLQSETPAGSYLVFEIPHTPEAVEFIWANGFGLVSENGYTYDETRPIIERYVKSKVNAGVCEVLFPIRQ